MKKIDMSSEAITRRLRRTDQLRELSLSLIKAEKSAGEKSKEKLQEKDAAKDKTTR